MKKAFLKAAFKKSLKFVVLILRPTTDRILLFFSYFVASLSGRFIKNVYGLQTNVNYLDKALLVYITSPFRAQHNSEHTNIRECQELARVISSLGFNVDVIDFRWDLPFSYRKYSLIVGFGDLYEKSFFDTNCSALRILYATGAPIAESSIAETRRVQLLEKRRGKRLLPRRVLDRVWPRSLFFSDAIICVTEGWASDEYRKYNNEVYCIPVTSACDPHTIKLEPQHRTRDFVWFGSWGAIHKGLDLCLEAFSNLDDVNFHVCGGVKSESDFWVEYEDLLTNRRNIYYHGFVDIRSETMNEIMRSSRFVILPSCSEGCATSVLTCMAWGCIPVVTKQAGIEFPYSIVIEGETVEEVRKAIEKCLSIEIPSLSILSEKAQRWIKEKHLLDCYIKGAKDSLESILGRHYKRINNEAQR